MHSVVAKAAIAFTGGKDCVLALHLVSRYFCAASEVSFLDPVVLVSFRPHSDDDDFKAHKHEWVRMQAESLGLPLVVKRIGGPDYEETYRRAIRELGADYGVTKLVTGDIEDVGEGFMDRAVTETGVDLVRPLWKMPRTQVLSLLQSLDIVYVVTLTRLDKLPLPISEQLLGHVVTHEYLLELFEWYNENHAQMDFSNVDLAGEFGEMHSMVRSCPLFQWQVVHSAGSNMLTESQFGSYMYLSPGKLSIIPK
ncbi:hypothetical protein GGI20_000746 [Coemansia sp. BCRC 34301]|nr:hypothetical protein GGI20_000746 [Coemansia sp. BCRC 34301]